MLFSCSFSAVRAGSDAGLMVALPLDLSCNFGLDGVQWDDMVCFSLFNAIRQDGLLGGKKGQHALAAS